MDETRSYTAAEAAKILNMSLDKVYRRINRGDLKASLVRVRNLHYRISGDDLQAYIDAGHGDELTAPNPNTAEFVGAPEVARMTGFTIETVRKMCYSGQLPYVRGSGARGHLRIPRTAIADLLERSSAQ